MLLGSKVGCLSGTNPINTKQAYREPSMPQYSFWLQPKGELASKLQKEVDFLAESYKGPTFEPHVTLIPGFSAPDDSEAIALGKDLARSLKAFDVTLDRVSNGEIFFQCVYILCQKDPDLMKANAQAVKTLNMNQWDYMPHLSLVYSENLPQEQRQIIADREQTKLLKGGSTSFLADSIALWITDPNDWSCKSWKRIEDLPLGK